MNEIVAHAATLDGAEPNRAAGFDACLDAGMLRIEVDVRVSEGQLILGHDAPAPDSPADLVAAVLRRAPECKLLMLDIKESPAAPLAAAVVAHAGLRNVVFASTDARDLAAIHAALPSARLSYSFPRDVPRVSQNARLARAVTAFLAVSRFVLPALLVYWTLRYRPTQFTLHWRTTSRPAFAIGRLLRRPIYCWTVDEPRIAARLLRAGATGVITNRPLAVTAALGRAQ